MMINCGLFNWEWLNQKTYSHAQEVLNICLIVNKQLLYQNNVPHLYSEQNTYKTSHIPVCFAVSAKSKECAYHSSPLPVVVFSWCSVVAPSNRKQVPKNFCPADNYYGIRPLKTHKTYVRKVCVCKYWKNNRRKHHGSRKTNFNPNTIRYR